MSYLLQGCDMSPDINSLDPRFCKLSSTMKTLAADYFFFLLFLSFKLNIACPEVEKQSLLSFKQTLKDPSNLLSSWNVEVNCCKWKFVICSNLTGHVHQLHLQGYDQSRCLHGKISPSLLHLKHLKYLDLSQNKFDETIPSFIGSLTSLEYLDLSFANFYGKIPNSIGNLSNLLNLALEDNSLDVNSLEWLAGLSKLEHLNMNNVDLGKVADWADQVFSKLSSLVELRFGLCNLTIFTADIVNNNSTNLAILDLSGNNLQSYAVTELIFQLRNLIFLDLSLNDIEGQIPSIVNTTKLKHIDLSYNNFSSSIPEWLYFCKDLEYVDLGNNALYNGISNSIGNLTSLNTLDLSCNTLSGNIPREISNMYRLQTLKLNDNKFQGVISDSFGNMSDFFLGSLEYLDLSNNQLSGHLTRQFAEFKNLRTLDLGLNSLSGEVPENIGNLSFLQYLSLGVNKLTGNLPASVGKLFNLELFDISNNLLEGVTTETHFSRLSRLLYLYASGNQLTLKVSPKWTPSFKLERLQLRSWNFSGFQIPSWLETQKKSLYELDLSCTGISGNVPSWIWNFCMLNLSHNSLHGNIPSISDLEDGYCGASRCIYLSSNKFRGPLPRVGNKAQELDLSNNSFSGGISHFLCDTMTNGTYNLEILHLGENHLTGELPDCFMKLPLLSMLNLGNNNFSGRIPDSIGFLANLTSLNLYGNKFSGRMPFSMRNCTQLVKIDLADNDLVGSIPKWIGTNLSNLKFLILRSNKLSGEITSTVCQLSSLQILDLSDNMFSGVIPVCINNFTAMTTKRSWRPLGFEYAIGAFSESASVDTKGFELQYDTILSLVTNIDLSNNHLSGDIPKELTSLVELRSLNLSENRLTGTIPETIGNMKQLESLDFSINSLSGEIPSSFTAMSSLSYLNLSYNNLTGRIPESTQLQSFNKSSFIGNNLCGTPLTNSCNNDGGGEDQDQEGDEPEIEWFYVFASLGHAVGLSGFLITLYFLKKSWRDAYYEFLEDMGETVYVYFYVKWRRLMRVASVRNS